MRTWYEIAGREYLAGSPDVTWSKLVERHFRSPGGYVVSRPEYFILARVVDEAWPDGSLMEVADVDPFGSMLHVDAFAGSWRRALEDLPGGIEVLSFQRRGVKVHRVPVRVFQRWCGNFTILEGTGGE